jgi:hypothetical protein
MVASFTHVGDGNGRYGTATYTRNFTIGDDIETHVYVDQHKTVVTKNGQVIRTMLSDAGNPKFPTWDGTMAVVGKAAKVRMTSCSVGIACNPKDPNFYDITLPWDVQITWSGTYLHYSTGDPHPGHSYGSHGCVHLSLADSQWFYNLSKTGDPVTVTGSPRGLAAGDNGYADYNVSWTDWLAGSGMGAVHHVGLTSPAEPLRGQSTFQSAAFSFLGLPGPGSILSLKCGWQGLAISRHGLGLASSRQ